MRGLIAWLVGTAMLATLGCAPAQECVVKPETRIAPAQTCQGADLAAALLFDRKPGRYSACDFAVRSDWPSTVSFYSPGQVIFFSERFVDYQGRGFGESDYTYRRFETRRVGVGYR